MRVPLTPLVLCAALAVATGALAQSPVKPPAEALVTQPGDTGPCPGGRATVGSNNEISTPNAGKGDKTLSEHLAQSGGVICPPSAVDPQIRAPTPNVGNMPIIKPPGTPGGDQSIQPK
jgi:hypothetical protein